MKFRIFFAILLATLLIGAQTQKLVFAKPATVVVSHEQELGHKSMSLETRYAVKSVNDVFKDNILLTLHYLAGTVNKPEDINWTEIRKPYTYDLVLKPGEVFAFHDDVLPEYKGRVTRTTRAHFNAQDGFESDGYLYGDGVCHFASLINYAAEGTGLKVLSPTRHDFANIPEVPREFGTSIYSGDQMQNLYIENTFDKPVHIVFDYKNSVLTVTVLKDK